MSIFIVKFFEITTELIKKHNLDQRISSFAIEIWNTLFEEDINNEKLYKG